MSRTTRRGKPSRNFAHYIKLGVISHEKNGFISFYGMKFISSWQKFYGQSYEEYASKAIHDYHRDTKSGKFCGFNSTPRYCRIADVNIQKAAHIAAIKKAFQTGDFDVVLVKLVKENSWNYW